MLIATLRITENYITCNESWTGEIQKYRIEMGFSAEMTGEL
jgi:hypothetical protein